MDTLTIAPAAGDDAEWCARVMSSTDPWVRLGRTLDDCRARCSHPEYVLAVARHRDGRRAAFILIHPRGVAGSPYIASIAAPPEERSRGIGSALVAWAEQYYPGACHMFLCVSSFNSRARDLYERLGYKVVAEFEDYVIQGASEFLMHKRLAPAGARRA